MGFAAQALTEPAYGIARYVRELLGAMAGLQPRPALVLFSAGRRRPAEFRGEWPQRHLPIPTRLFGRLFVDLPLPVELLAGRMDAVHAPDVGGLRSRAPLVVTVHDLVTFRMPELFPGLYTAAYNPGYAVYRRATRRAVARAAEVICISESTRADLLREFDLDPGRVSVVPYGAPLPPAGFAPTPRADRPRVLFMGRVEHRKNLPAAVDAVARLRAGGLDAELRVCGDRAGVESAPIVAECERLAGGGDWLVWRGRVDQARVWEEYAAADALVYPSWYEGFGLPPLEAFAAGVPVVAADTSALPEVLGGAALLVPPDRPDRVAEALAQVLAGGSVADGLRAAGRARAAELTWERAARSTLEVYERARAR